MLHRRWTCSNQPGLHHLWWLSPLKSHERPNFPHAHTRTPCLMIQSITMKISWTFGKIREHFHHVQTSGAHHGSWIPYDPWRKRGWDIQWLGGSSEAIVVYCPPKKKQGVKELWIEFSKHMMEMHSKLYELIHGSPQKPRTYYTQLRY